MPPIWNVTEPPPACGPRGGCGGFGGAGAGVGGVGGVGVAGFAGFTGIGGFAFAVPGVVTSLPGGQNPTRSASPADAWLNALPNSRPPAIIDGRTVDLIESRPLALGELASVLGGERALNEGLRGALENGAWFTTSLPAILDDFRPLRNVGTHQSRVDRATALRWRDRLLGVGCAGDFVELAKVTIKQPRGLGGLTSRTDR